jgi:hypothetical protein
MSGRTSGEERVVVKPAGKGPAESSMASAGDGNESSRGRTGRSVMARAEEGKAGTMGQAKAGGAAASARGAVWIQLWQPHGRKKKQSCASYEQCRRRRWC